MGKPDKIEVICVRPECTPEVIEIDNDLESMQKLVGGNIEEVLTYADGVVLIANEESKFWNLPFNRAVYDSDDYIDDIIHGPFFLCYGPVDSTEYLSVPENLKEKHIEEFKDIEKYEINETSGMMTIYNALGKFRAILWDSRLESPYYRALKSQKSE